MCTSAEDVYIYVCVSLCFMPVGLLIFLTDFQDLVSILQRLHLCSQTEKLKCSIIIFLHFYLHY